MIEHFIDELHLQYAFLVAKSNSIRGFVRPSVGPSVRPSVSPFFQIAEIDKLTNLTNLTPANLTNLTESDKSDKSLLAILSKSLTSDASLFERTCSNRIKLIMIRDFQMRLDSI